MLAKAQDSWTLQEAAHLLNRAGFGGTPAEIAQFHSLGRHKAVDSLFEASDAPDFLPVPEWAMPEQAIAARRQQVRLRAELRRSTREMTQEEADRTRREANRMGQREARQQTGEAQAWWFRRMLLTKTPLREKMTLFWHDHFATSAQKVRQPALLLAQNELFRSHAFGSFKDLTRAIVRDPAMMLYLDIRNSRKGMPNENFAREILELFTLGEGNYTEDDIREAARAFTGYRFNLLEGQVIHQRRQWDSGPKQLFGKTSRFDGDGVVDAIFEQPAAARFLPAKLWEYFVEEVPSAGVVQALATRFIEERFETGPLIREIFLSREFYAPSVMRAQIKSPIQYLVQLLKQLEITNPPPGFLVNAQQQLGQVLFMPPNVAGWDWGKAWINTNTLLTRYNLAGFLTKGGEVPGDNRPQRQNRPAMEDMEMGEMKKDMAEMNPRNRPGPARRNQGAWQGPDYESLAPRPLREDCPALVDALMLRFFQTKLSDKQRDSFIAYAEAKKGVVFTNKEVGELCHLILSTPYYQLC